jgi:uncharacterized membrane protein YqjE
MRHAGRRSGKHHPHGAPQRHHDPVPHDSEHRQPVPHTKEAIVARSRSHPPTDYTWPAGEPASIPMTAEPPTDPNGTVGELVKDAATHVSTLVRAEIELAKLELTASVKQALRGSLFFAAAAAIGLFSLWFFWLMVGEILDIWLPRWAAFAIVFGAMLVMAAGLVALGVRRMKKIKKPEKTLQEAAATADALKKAAAR